MPREQTAATRITDERPVLVAPVAFCGLRATAVAAAIGRGLEAAGMPPPDLCPLSDGGPGTAEVLITVLGGTTADGYVLLEDDRLALIEGGDPERIAARIAAAVAAGADLVVLAAAGTELEEDSSAGAVLSALDARGAAADASALLVLCRAPALRRDGAWERAGARLAGGAAFVLDALGTDARMRAARAVVVGEPVLDAGTLAGRATGELATRARQSGVPCHAIAGDAVLDLFGRRIIDLQTVGEAQTLGELEAEGAALAARL